jgi:D-lyxose ketol-isomerase
MIYKSQEKALRKQAAEILRQTHFPVTETELDSIAVADFGLSNPLSEGAQILTLFATARISAKLIVLLPNQILPEHWHPPVGDDPGKEEILRGFWGTVRYFEEGPDALDSSLIPAGKQDCFTCTQRRDLNPGDQVIIPPGVKHWMQGGVDGGCVISFSTCVRDILDQFTDRLSLRTTRLWMTRNRSIL